MSNSRVSSYLLKKIRYGDIEFKVTQSVNRRGGTSDLREVCLISEYRGEMPRSKPDRSININELEVQMLLKAMGIEQDLRANLVENLFNREV